MENKKVVHTTKLTSKSIERSGLPIDYKRAIAEFIWNGFDAKATTINIDYKCNEIGFINQFSIKDNGSGINIENIGSTFGNFNDSLKALSYSEISSIKGKKGKGRYSFAVFCNNAIWDTVFSSENGDLLNYKIEINRENSQNYSTDEKRIVKNTNAGTIVLFDKFHSLTGDLLDSEDFYSFLSSEFGWFLYLNKDQDFKILINGTSLNYFEIIEENDDKEIVIGEYVFKVSYIRWDKKIGDKYYYYFLRTDKKQVDRKHTSFNNKAVDFHHSIYVESNYFDNYKPTAKDSPVLDFGDKNQSDYVYKELVRLLNEFVAEKEKFFIRSRKADQLIENFNKKKIFPAFKSNNYEQLRKKDLENVIKELYCIQPRIFQKLNEPQTKTIVGFLNLLLDTEQRENVLEIIDNVVKLTDEERQDLANILKSTKLSHITALIKFLENRFNVVEILKTLIFDLEKFTNERDHIQKVIENNYWLFGEQYHLVSADKNFEVLLNNYLFHIEENGKVPEKIESKSKLKRPDIFISRKIYTVDSSNDEYVNEENIIIELKRPSVIIGKEQFSQIEDYMGIIINDARFNSQLRKWKFYLIGKEVDSYIKGLYKNQVVRNKKFLVQEIDNYEIYALTWDDIFKIFEIRHNNFINKLEYNKSSIIEELESKGIVLNKDASNELTNIAVKNY